jgi:hypothetical protein
MTPAPHFNQSRTIHREFAVFCSQSAEKPGFFAATDSDFQISSLMIFPRFFHAKFPGPFADKGLQTKGSKSVGIPQIIHPEVATVMNDVVALPTLEELTIHVHLKLCQPDRLDPAQTPLLQTVITRKGKPCGLFFQAQGPRMVKHYAVWAGEENRILFYNSSGVRIAETLLSETPNPDLLVA